MAAATKENLSTLSPYIISREAPISLTDKANIYVDSLVNWKEAGEPKDCVVFNGALTETVPWKDVYVGATEVFMDMVRDEGEQEARITFQKIIDFTPKGKTPPGA